MWQTTHPALLNAVSPAAICVAVTVPYDDTCASGARNRMKFAKLLASSMICCGCVSS